PITQFPADRPEDTRTSGPVIVLDEYGGVLIELDVGAVGSTLLLHRTDDDGLHQITTSHVGSRDGLLDGADDHVAHTRIAPTRAAEHADGQDFLGTRVVGNS